MYFATGAKNRAIFELLPDHGVDRGWTAMHQAASRGNEKMMRIKAVG
jgi:hypothetical protein